MSLSIKIQPTDRRCRYWAKIIRKGGSLPLPNSVDAAVDIPSPYVRLGDEELFEGDFLIEGEENHHRRQRGWSYHVSFIGPNMELVRISPSSAIKAFLKSQGLEPSLLMGAGDLAACIRIAHGINAGLKIKEES